MRPCNVCGGSGAVDSGGSTPWGEFVLVPCECQGVSKLSTDTVEAVKEETIKHTQRVTVELPALPDGFEYTGGYGSINSKKHGLSIQERMSGKERWLVVVDRHEKYELGCDSFSRMTSDCGFIVRKVPRWRAASFNDGSLIIEGCEARFKNPDDTEWTYGKIRSAEQILTSFNKCYWHGEDGNKYEICEILADDWVPESRSFEL
jgi:hypothetical protein